MYIIACIEERVCYWNDDRLLIGLEEAMSRLTYLQANGKEGINIYKITDMEKVY